MIGTVVAACVAGFAVWVYWDATAHGVGKIKDTKAWWNMTAGSWAIMCFGFSIVGVPAYLYKRSDLIALAKDNPVQVSGRVPKLVLLALAGVALVAVYIPGSRLPACESPEVTALAQQAVQQRIPGATLLNTAEDVAASSGDVRVCRTQLHSALGPDEWVRFSVSPHGDSQIFVQFMQ